MKRAYFTNCKICNKEFKTFPSIVKLGRHQTCSWECRTTLMKTKTPWNKGKTTGQKVWNKGIKRTDINGEKHPHWLGDKVGYQGVHSWIRKTLGRPSKCSNCGTTQSKKFEWANKSYEYKRDASDWMRLCKSCHVIYDRKNGWGKAQEFI